MHLWPSAQIRDSFKISYLKNLEWNLQRMKSEKQSATNRQKLLDKEESVVCSNGVKDDVIGTQNSSKMFSKIVGFCTEVAMLLSCCYCCFCCGACLDQEEK